MTYDQKCLTRAAVAAALLLRGLAGCADSNNEPPPNTAPTQVTAAAINAQESATLSDGQIVGIVAVIDGAEVAAGKLALSRAANAATRQFALHMMTAHADMDAALMTVANGQNIAKAESGLCEKLKGDNDAEAQTLASTKSSSFDSAYLEAQVKGHRDVLDLLDGKLIPMAQSPALKAALQEARGKVVEHLRMAKEALTAAGG
jgi:putative membrane protein